MEKAPKLRKVEGKRTRDWHRMRLLGSITDSMYMTLSKFLEIVKDRRTWHAAWGRKRVGHDLVTEQ